MNIYIYMYIQAALRLALVCGYLDGNDKVATPFFNGLVHI